MQTTSVQTTSVQSNRLLSIDFMRGFIMVLLVLESTGLYKSLNEISLPSGMNALVQQFSHHPWNGLRFWDLVQPGFMFIAGIAMASSLEKQFRNGVPWKQVCKKVLKRSWWLFFWGVLDYAVAPDGSLSFELWDVLAQLSFTTLVAFLVFRWSYSKQIMCCVALLLLTEILYRFTRIPGFDQPFVDQHNFGNYMDLVLMNKVNGDGWVAINCIPTSVHTIAGVMAGKILTNRQPLRWLMIGGMISLVAGYVLDLGGITPIIKRIATTSFTLVSLGWCLLALMLVYWWIDVRDHRKYLKFFIIPGMNSLFIYLFCEIVGNRWFNGYVGSISNGLMGMLSLPHQFEMIATSLVIFSLEWFLCYFLFRKGIFLKL